MVLADGCFDPLHVGHIAYLKAAARVEALGRHLVVNVAPDDAIRAKGREPFQTADERKRMLTEIMWFIDRVTIGYLADVIRDEQPEFLVKGIEWQGCIPADVLEACAEVGTHLVFTQTRGPSSSERLAGWTMA